MERLAAVSKYLCTCLAVILLLFLAPLMAQTNRGTITGTVTDSSRAPVPAATVIVTGSSTGTTYNLTTSSEGVYAAAELPFGHYKVHVEKTGFRPVDAPDVVVTANQLTVFDTILQVGNV